MLGGSVLIFQFEAAAQLDVVGQWSAVKTLPIETVHVHVLPTGKVLFSAYGDDARLWDPATETITLASLAGYNLFCAGHSMLPDGRLLLTGGHIANNTGLSDASVYDPFTGRWTRGPNMNAGRWYPTNTTMANGDVLVVGGAIDDFVGRNLLPQVWNNLTGTWRDLVTAQLDLPLYPAMFLAPNGRVFTAAPVSRYLDTSGTGNWSLVALTGYGFRDYGSAVLYDEGKILLVGGADPPTNTAEVIDLKAPTPAWRWTNSMANSRRQLNATILADGKVLATGGSSGPGFDNSAAPVYAAEIWDPATEQWSGAGASARYRGYHSSVVLLPDGRVFSGGGSGQLNYEIYSPPYLFRGARPTISSAPQRVSYGTQFSVGTPNSASITKVHLIRLGSVTHSFHMDQRINRLAFTAQSGSLTVTAPASGNVAPPGYYMLFLLNGSGVPSVARIIQVGPQPTGIPSVPSLLAATPSNGAVALSWQVAAGATSYKVFRSNVSNSYNYGAPLATVPTPAYTDTSATNGIPQYYVVRATNALGDSLSSNQVSVTPSSSYLTGTATFITTDTTTLGNWIGVYGAQGHHIVNDGVQYPAYAQVTIADASPWTWMASTFDVRALQKPATPGDRIASAFTTQTFFTIDLTITDGQRHRVAMYFLDWDTNQRAQTVDIVDPFSQTRLDSRILRNFNGGVYLVWELSGRVQIRVTKEAYLGANGVLSGFFFDPAASGGNVPPTVSVTSPLNGATFVAPATINIQANASDSDGTVTKVEFFQGATKIGEDLTAPYSFSWTSVPQGSYSLTAKATDNAGAIATSSAVNVTVNAPSNSAPSISITSPANGATFVAPANITIQASASDADGTVTKVEFFLGATKLGEDLTSPYSFAWSNVGQGSYSLTARATDNGGATRTSTAVNITVNAATLPAAPSGLSASALSSSSIRLNWIDNSNNEQGFKIERWIGSSWSQIGTVGANISTFTNTGLSGNTRYYYRVRAYNTAGNSAYSSVANAKTN